MTYAAPRGESAAGPPDVRYATAPLAEATWQQATAVKGPWQPAGEDGRLQAIAQGLAPVVHYIAARAVENGAPILSKSVPVRPFREAVAHGNVAEGFFGHTVAMAGDVNGDGYEDFIVGAPWSDEGLEGARPRWVQLLRRGLRAMRAPLSGGKAGAAFVFMGSAAGPSSAPSWILLGRADGEFLGSSVAGIGDANRDGYADIAVGIPGYDTHLRDEGAVAIYYGRAGTPPGQADLLLFGKTRDESFGAVVAGIGDVNGDGYADVAFGAPGSNLGAPNGGAVFIHYGGVPGLRPTAGTVLVGRTFDGLFGSALAGVGDVNGDGYADVLVGAYEGVGDPGAAGAAYLYYGGAAGLSTIPALVLRGGRGGEQFGSALAALGDVDGDGFSDFAVAAPKHGAPDEETGAVFIFHGSPRGPEASPRAVLKGEKAGAGFGGSVAGVGDQDGDGFPDLVVSAAGTVFLFRGGPQGIRPDPALMLADDASRARAGLATAGGGDLNGDRRPDLVIGTGSQSARGRNSGSVLIRY